MLSFLSCSRWSRIKLKPLKYCSWQWWLINKSQMHQCVTVHSEHVVEDVIGCYIHVLCQVNCYIKLVFYLYWITCLDISQFGIILSVCKKIDILKWNTGIHIESCNYQHDKLMCTFISCHSCNEFAECLSLFMVTDVAFEIYSWAWCMLWDV